jgi:asparagine synthase (glutamine-hydrolysing)
MCGLAGFLSSGAFVQGSESAAQLRSMTDALLRRGPDSAGYWLDGDAGIALGHRRLAILDLTESGAQPMRSPCGRFVMVFNGEIYNHLDIRDALASAGAAPVWRGHSDTETLLAGFSTWGIRPTVERAVGMFAFAVWDRRERVLTLGRDRMGEKPLYFGFQGQGAQRTFLFGSELKALARHPAFEARLSMPAVHLLMRHNYVPDPYSIYAGISKLEPGTLLHLTHGSHEPTVERYWSFAEAAVSGVQSPLSLAPEEATDELERLISRAVRGQMLADVPLGAFLSGGVDSSTIVALMQAQSARPVKTFTIGFEETGFDESEHAGKVARHLGTDHTTMILSGQQARDVIPLLPTLYCEPFSDSSQIPTFLVSQLARRQVTVALSGDAGDELFAGYNRYILTHDVWHRLSRLPMPVRKVMARVALALPPHRWNGIAGLAMRALPQSMRLSDPGQKIHKAAGVLSAASIDELYRGVVSHWDPATLLRAGAEPATLLTGLRPELRGLSDIERMMALDALTYLPGDILAKVDRAAMGVSLETRVPLLDHRVVEWAWRVPLRFKLRDGTGKWLLRQVLYRHVPRELIERPKMGFGIPVDAWLRGPLREWASSLLEPRRIAAQGIFDSSVLQRSWDDHLSGRGNQAYRVWDVLMFQSWFETHRPRL